MPKGIFALLVAFPFIAHAVTPRLIAGYDFSCLLGEAVGQPELRCWDPKGRALKVPPLKNPTALAATSHDVCAIDEGRVTCWEYARGRQLPHQDYQGPDLTAAGDNFAGRVERAFSKIEGGQLLTAGTENDFCLVDKSDRLRCFGERPHWVGSNANGHLTQKPSPVSQKTPPLLHVLQVALNTDLGCAITADKKVVCWTGEDPDADKERARCAAELAQGLPKLSDPREIMLPLESEIQTGYLANDNYCRACVLDGNEVRCWGKDLSDQGERSPIVFPPLEAPHGLLLEQEGNRPCVISGRKLICSAPADDDWIRSLRRFMDVPGGVEIVARSANFDTTRLHASGITFCAANEKALQCHFMPDLNDHQDETSWNFDPRIEHGLSLGPLDDLRANLLGMAPRLYKSKAGFFQRTAELLEKEYAAASLAKPEIDRFVAFALAPLVEGSSGDYIEQTVIPYFHLVIKRGSEQRLSDFPRDEAHRHLTLALLQASVPLLQGFDASDQVMPDYLRALGNLIAAPASTKELAALRAAYPPVGTYLRSLSDPHAKGVAEMLEGLVLRVLRENDQQPI